MPKDPITGIDSSKHSLAAPVEYTTEQLLVIALIESKKAVDQCNLYAKVVGLPPCPMPHVLFGIRGCTAATAWNWHPEVNGPAVVINEGLFRTHTKGFIDRTLPHEVAHIAADKWYAKRCGHGPEWKFVMSNVLGKDPSRCHNYDVHEGKEVMKAVRDTKRR